MIPKLIIFDFDGTLADTTAIILATYRLAIAALGTEGRSDAECRATIGLPLKEGFRQLYPGFSDGQLDECVATYRRIFNENKSSFAPRLYPGVKATLDELARRGIQMSVASSRSRESLVEFCAHNGIAHHFALVLGADDVAHAKPHPEPVLITLERLNKEADSTLVVGDMPVDIAMGRGAGCRTVGVTYGNSSRHDLADAGADCIIDTFPALLQCMFLRMENRNNSIY